MEKARDEQSVSQQATRATTIREEKERAPMRCAFLLWSV